MTGNDTHDRTTPAPDVEAIRARLEAATPDLVPVEVEIEEPTTGRRDTTTMVVPGATVTVNHADLRALLDAHDAQQQRIAALEAENARLRLALREAGNIASENANECYECESVAVIARRALESEATDGRE